MAKRLIFLGAALAIFVGSGLGCCPASYLERDCGVSPVDEFLGRTLTRDLVWGHQDRQIRFHREQQDRKWGEYALTPMGVEKPQAVDPILDRLYGQAPPVVVEE